jgi:hypothetical protein
MGEGRRSRRKKVYSKDGYEGGGRCVRLRNANRRRRRCSSRCSSWRRGFIQRIAMNEGDALVFWSLTHS